MPATFAHPAAVLPLRRPCPTNLNFAALAIGSMAPDLGYFLGQWELATYAHTFPGSILICIPSALLMFCAFRLLRKPLAFLSPQPHRRALAPLAEQPLHHSWRSWISVAVSTLVGAWTHCVWDSFTHANGLAVQHIDFLRAPLFTVGQTEFLTFYILQQASTIVGSVVLVVAYVTWLRANQAGSDAFAERNGERANVPDSVRYACIAAAALLSVVAALIAAGGIANEFDGFLALRVFLFRTAVYSIAGFVPLVIAIALVIYHAAGRRL